MSTPARRLRAGVTARLLAVAASRPVAADPLAELEAAQQALYDRVAPAVV